MIVLIIKVLILYDQYVNGLIFIFELILVNNLGLRSSVLISPYSILDNKCFVMRLKDSSTFSPFKALVSIY